MKDNQKNQESGSQVDQFNLAQKMEQLKKLKQNYLQQDNAQSARVQEPQKLTETDSKQIEVQKEGGIFVNPSRNSDGLLQDYLEVQSQPEDLNNISAQDENTQIGTKNGVAPSAMNTQEIHDFSTNDAADDPIKTEAERLISAYKTGQSSIHSTEVQATRKFGKNKSIDSNFKGSYLAAAQSSQDLHINSTSKNSKQNSYLKKNRSQIIKFQTRGSPKNNQINQQSAEKNQVNSSKQSVKSFTKFITSQLDKKDGKGSFNNTVGPQTINLPSNPKFDMINKEAMFREEQDIVFNKCKESEISQIQADHSFSNKSTYNEQIQIKSLDYRPLFNDKLTDKKLRDDQKKQREMNSNQKTHLGMEPDEFEIEMIKARQLKDLDRQPKQNVNSINITSPDYSHLLNAQQQKFNNLQLENERLKHFLPDSYTEMRLREKQLQERMSRYEQSIIDYENEKKALIETIKLKDEDIVFIKTKYEETNALWHQENLEKQKLEAVIEQQYRESMELDAMRRKAEEDKNYFRNKNISYKSEIGELVKENKKYVAERTALGSRLQSLRNVNKQLERKLDNQMQPLKKNAIYVGTERKMQETEKWAEELEEKLSFTVEKFEEQNQRFMQCGKELSEAQELIEKLESSLDETNELKRMLQIQNTALKSENIGEIATKGSLYQKTYDGLSQKTGRVSIGATTKVSEGAHDKTDDLSMRSAQPAEKITIEFLKQQNEAQLQKIKHMEKQLDLKHQNTRVSSQTRENRSGSSGNKNLLRQKKWEH